jgi:hypothetical protein
MKEWEYDDYEEQPMCECGITVNYMNLKMRYTYSLDVCIYGQGIKNTYGAAEDYGQKSELVCSCGKVYREDEDYRVKWEEQDDGWVWTLEVETEVSDARD